MHHAVGLARAKTPQHDRLGRVGGGHPELVLNERKQLAGAVERGDVVVATNGLAVDDDLRSTLISSYSIPRESSSAFARMQKGHQSAE